MHQKVILLESKFIGMEFDDNYVEVENEICKRCVIYEFCTNYLEGDICTPLTILRFLLVEDKITIKDIRNRIAEWKKFMKVSQEC